jgi:hypothetical protein
MKLGLNTKFAFIALLITLLPLVGFSQPNCASFIKYQVAQYPFRYNSQSKSAACASGKTYKFLITLQADYDYKISFYASSIFDNKMKFKIIDEGTGKTVLDLPGEATPNDKQGLSVLVAPVLAEKEADYPFFEFHPVTTTRLQIQIDVEKVAEGQDDKRGCIGVLIMDKKGEGSGF